MANIDPSSPDIRSWPPDPSKLTVFSPELPQYEKAVYEVSDDKRFRELLTLVKELKKFLFDEYVRLEPDDLSAIDLGVLNALRFRRGARSPAPSEWILLDEKLTHLTKYLTDDLRTKLRLFRLSFYFTRLPFIFLFVALSTLILAVQFRVGSQETSQLATFVAAMAWTLALGGLGACGFLSTALLNRPQGLSDLLPVPKNSISSFDLTDRNLLNTRLAVGLLFSFVLGIPFAHDSLISIVRPFFDKTATFKVSEIPAIISPFLFGFSTTLVLGIMERMLQAIRAFFGMSDDK